jgi:hypothetical protein
MLLLILLPSLLLLLAPGHGEAAAASATVSLKTVSSWNGGSQVSVVIKNTGTMAICAATFRLTLPSGVNLINFLFELIIEIEYEYTAFLCTGICSKHFKNLIFKRN